MQLERHEVAVASQKWLAVLDGNGRYEAINRSSYRLPCFSAATVKRSGVFESFWMNGL
jgi:hypothetical protein